MSRIVLLLTKTPWGDRRQFHRQGPALTDDGHEVLYVAAEPDRDLDHPFRYIALSPREIKLARRTMGLSLLRKISALRPDLVQLCSLELLPLGLALKALRRTKVVYDCREDIASALRERRKRLPGWARDLLFHTVRALERSAAARFDGIVTADPGVYELHSKMPATRKHVFYNTALLSQFPAGYPPLHDRLFELAVLGSMSSERSGTHTVLDAMGELKKRDLHPKLLLIGEPEGEVIKTIQDRIARHSLEGQVEITGLIPHHEVASQLHRARVGIVPLLDFPKFHRNIACKAFEYMACGMPTIASDLPPQHIFLHPKISTFYPCGDVGALADRIEEMLQDPEHCIQMGNVARDEVESRWNAENEQTGYAEFYESLLAMPAR
jgi:glycosyltransferase involved in cell wall biosynthesis